LSTETSLRISQFVKTRGEQGTRILLLFKLIKSELEKQLYSNIVMSASEELKLNQICLEKAQELARIGKTQPTEEDVRGLIANIMK